MELSHKIIKIVEDSSDLLERIRGDLFEPDPVQDSEIIEKRLSEFKQIAAKNDSKNFTKLLEWYGLTEASLKPWLGQIHLGSGATLPSWAETLTEVLNYPKTVSETLKSSVTDFDNPLPFEDIFLFMVVLAKEKLLTKLNCTQGDLAQLLSESAWFALQRQLLNEISQIAFVTLFKEWEKQIDLPLVYKLVKIVAKPEEKTQVYYKIFVDKLLSNDGLLNLFENYPVLAKLLAIKIDFWIDSSCSFINRLKNDWGEIHNNFSRSKNDSLAPVVDLQSGLSDPHNQGCRVIALTFASGLKLIYKPKNLDIAIAYHELLEWVNSQGVSLNLKTLNILKRSEYGWIEYLEHLPCENELAASRFYHRAGMLLCISYILNSTDCLQENFIASGEHFVLIDFETVVYNNRGTIKDKYNHISINEEFSDSVVNTGILPAWYKYNEYIYYDFSALGTFENQILTKKYPYFKNINTDYIHIAYEEFVLDVKKNIPQLNQENISPKKYLKEILNGFNEVYKLFLQQRENLLREGSILANFLDLKIRFIFRNTNIYAEILQNSLIPKLFKSGIDRSIALNVLSRPILLSTHKPTDWEAFLAEVKAMEVLDIPYFMGNVSSGDLETEFGTVIKDYFKESAYNKILNKINCLGEKDLIKQNCLLEASFFAKFFRLTHRTNYTESVSDENNNILTEEQLIREAITIGQEILSYANQNQKNLDWLSLIHIPYSNLLQIHVLKANLFDGTLGIALFFTALAKVTNSLEFYEAAENALKNSQRILNDLDLTQQLIQYSDKGATTGLGSMIYCLVKISQFSPDKKKKTKLLENANKLAQYITVELSETDHHYNIMTGVAGTLLGLLSLYQETGCEEILFKARCCGNHLLKGYSLVNKHNHNQGFLTGTAGISYGLLRLYEVTKNNDYLKAAREGILEQTKFLANCDQSSWCHGSSGIGLTLLAGLSVLDGKEIKQDLLRAIQMIIDAEMIEVDDLCCGNMGSLELLIEAEKKLSSPDLLEIAKEKASRVITLRHKTGSYRIYPGAPKSLYLPGFLKGTAGIGYQLLRLAHKDRLPSILLWE